MFRKNTAFKVECHFLWRLDYCQPEETSPAGTLMQPAGTLTASAGTRAG